MIDQPFSDTLAVSFRQIVLPGQCPHEECSEWRICWVDLHLSNMVRPVLGL